MCFPKKLDSFIDFDISGVRVVGHGEIKEDNKNCLQIPAYRQLKCDLLVQISQI